MGFVNSSKLTTERDYRIYHKHVKDITKLLQVGLSKYEITIKPEHHVKIPIALLNLLNKNNSVDGMIYPQQIKAFLEILDLLVRKNDQGQWEYVCNKIAISALTMSGKTGLINIVGGFLPPIIKLLTGVMCEVTGLLTNNTDLEQQAKAAAGKFQALYQDVIFQHKEKSITSWEYSDELKGIEKSDADVTIVGKKIRTSPSNRAIFRKNSCKNIRQIAFIDEADARCDNNSVMAEMLADWSPGAEGEFISPDDSCLALSATNDAFYLCAKQNGYPCVEMLPSGVQYENENKKPEKMIYTGYPWINGRKLKNMHLPKVSSFAELDSELSTVGDPIQMLDFNCWKKTHRSGSEANWVQARSKWIAAFVKTIKSCILSNTDNKGMIVRIVSNNSMMLRFVNILQEKIPEVKVLLHNQDETKQIAKQQKEKHATATLEEHVDVECGPISERKPYIVIVTGKGRRGSVAPKDCKIGMDFTKKSEPNTLLQGIAGRLTGYFKGVTWVILSDYNAKLLKHYIQTGKWMMNGTMISPNKKHIGNSENHSTAIPFNEIPENVRHQIEKEIKKIAKVVETSEQSKSKYKIERLQNGPCFPWSLLEPIILKHEAKNNCHILRPTKEGTAKSGEYIQQDKNGDVNVAVRFAENNARTNSNLITDRDSQGNQRTAPVIIIDKKGNLLNIKFRLSSVKFNKELKKKSMYYAEKNVA